MKYVDVVLSVYISNFPGTPEQEETISVTETETVIVIEEEEDEGCCNCCCWAKKKVKPPVSRSVHPY